MPRTIKLMTTCATLVVFLWPIVRLSHSVPSNDKISCESVRCKREWTSSSNCPPWYSCNTHSSLCRPCSRCNAEDARYRNTPNCQYPTECLTTFDPLPSDMCPRLKVREGSECSGNCVPCQGTFGYFLGTVCRFKCTDGDSELFNCTFVNEIAQWNITRKPRWIEYERYALTSRSFKLQEESSNKSANPKVERSSKPAYPREESSSKPANPKVESPSKPAYPKEESSSKPTYPNGSTKITASPLRAPPPTSTPGLMTKTDVIIVAVAVVVVLVVVVVALGFAVIWRKRKRKRRRRRRDPNEPFTPNSFPFSSPPSSPCLPPPFSPCLPPPFSPCLPPPPPSPPPSPSPSSAAPSPPMQPNEEDDQELCPLIEDEPRPRPVAGEHDERAGVEHGESVTEEEASSADWSQHMDHSDTETPIKSSCIQETRQDQSTELKTVDPVDDVVVGYGNGAKVAVECSDSSYLSSGNIISLHPESLQAPSEAEGGPGHFEFFMP